VSEIMQARFNPATCNIYLFYASDGDNAPDDQAPARNELEGIAKLARYAGYVEITAASPRGTPSETSRLFQDIAAGGLPSGRFTISGPDDVAAAVRHFFTAEARAAAQGAEPAGTPGGTP
jgi:hypothetical protein